MDNINLHFNANLLPNLSTLTEQSNLIKPSKSMTPLNNNIYIINARDNTEYSFLSEEHDYSGWLSGGTGGGW